MELAKIEEKIKAYLAQDELEYFEGCELYALHPKARQNVVINLKERHSKQPVMGLKLIYELEKAIGAKMSNRIAVPVMKEYKPDFAFYETTLKEAPQDFEYKVKFEDLPEDLKTLAIEKGQLYNELDKQKKALASYGESNDVKNIAKRKITISVMHDITDRIKKIHVLLSKYDNTRELDQKDLDGFFSETETPVAEEPAQTEEEQLQEEFQYQGMNYWQLKDLLKRLRSSVPKQEKRAMETNKKEVEEKNQQKAELGRKMIAWLENYFDTTPEPES